MLASNIKTNMWGGRNYIQQMEIMIILEPQDSKIQVQKIVIDEKKLSSFTRRS